MYIYIYIYTYVYLYVCINTADDDFNIEIYSKRACKLLGTLISTFDK